MQDYCMRKRVIHIAQVKGNVRTSSVKMLKTWVNNVTPSWCQKRYRNSRKMSEWCNLSNAIMVASHKSYQFWYNLFQHLPLALYAIPKLILSWYMRINPLNVCCPTRVQKAPINQGSLLPPKDMRSLQKRLLRFAELDRIASCGAEPPLAGLLVLPLTNSYR